MGNKCCEKCYGTISAIQWWCNNSSCLCHIKSETITKAQDEEERKGIDITIAKKEEVEKFCTIHYNYFSLPRDRKRTGLLMLKKWVEEELEANERCKIRYPHDEECKKCRGK